jgi:succinoglycan biosynthesis protein ExoV
MKLFVYKGSEANFGDELNEWLIPRVLPGLLDDDESNLLLAIGSILYDHHPQNVRKIVFGSGYGGYTAVPKLDASWDVRCLRGPLTARALGVGEDKVAGDTAILLRDHYQSVAKNRWPVSFIPHFQSIRRGHWQRVCRLAGVNFIDPRQSVDTVLSQISASGLIVSEAMHGVITSDALRIPWIAVTPIDTAHHMKWHDWAGALDVRVRFQKVGPTSLREQFFGSSRNGFVHSRPGRVAGLPVDLYLIMKAAAALRRVVSTEPQLSSDAAIERATDKLRTAAATLIHSYSKR